MQWIKRCNTLEQAQLSLDLLLGDVRLLGECLAAQS